MERISVTARLNGTTLQFEEVAYARLESYLADAARTLAGNPDRDEILADLEQAVADQCRKRLEQSQGVIGLAVLQPALDEIGAVQEPDAAGAAQAAATGDVRDRPRPDAPRRLEQVSEGALISGVCQGLARYFRVDVTLLRVAAVLLLLVSGGAMILVYLVLMLLLPYAPPEPGGAPVRAIPAKIREFVEFLRSKLNAVTS
jgi:phage shock protein PspC (stress-responsive transcriptional regulator)